MTATASAAKANGMRFIDSDGHVLEHPTEMQRYAPTGFEDRVWHIETDAKGDEWIVMDGRRQFANPSAQAGTAGMTLEDRERAARAELKYTEVRPAAYNAKARLDDMDLNWVDGSLPFPTFPRFCGQTFHENEDRELGLACVQAYNDWMVEEWCAPSGGMNIPLCIIPLWDPELVEEGFTRVTWETQEEMGGITRLTVTHELEGAPKHAAQISSTAPLEQGGGGWSWILSDLKTLLESGKPLS